MPGQREIEDGFIICFVCDLEISFKADTGSFLIYSCHNFVFYLGRETNHK